MSDEKKLARAWVQYAENFWAFESLNELLNKSHDEAWPVIIEIINSTNSDAVLEQVAVGPLEDILTAFGDEYFDKVNGLAADNEKFKKCLSMGIRISGEGSEKIKRLILEIQKEINS